MARHHTEAKNPAMNRFFIDLGVRIKQLREKKKLSQEVVSSKVKVSVRHYQDMEAGYVVSSRMLWSVAKALDTSVSNLTRGLGPGRD